MKKLLLLCAMGTITVGLYGAAAAGYRYENGELIRPGGLSQAAAMAKARELVDQHGPKLNMMHNENYTNMLAGALVLGDNAADSADLVLDRIKTTNRIFAHGYYQNLPERLKEMIQSIPGDNADELAQKNEELDAIDY